MNKIKKKDVDKMNAEREEVLYAPNETELDASYQLMIMLRSASILTAILAVKKGVDIEMALSIAWHDLSRDARLTFDGMMSRYRNAH